MPDDIMSDVCNYQDPPKGSFTGQCTAHMYPVSEQWQPEEESQPARFADRITGMVSREGILFWGTWIV